MNKITKIVAAGLLAAAAVTGLAGCGQSEQEKALAPYVGKWKYEIHETAFGKNYDRTSVWIIKKDDKNENALISSITHNTAMGERKKMDTSVHTISYDANRKIVLVDGTENIVIQKDDKGDYITGTKGSSYQNVKYYKEK